MNRLQKSVSMNVLGHVLPTSRLGALVRSSGARRGEDHDHPALHPRVAVFRLLAPRGGQAREVLSERP